MKETILIGSYLYKIHVIFKYMYAFVSIWGVCVHKHRCPPNPTVVQPKVCLNFLICNTGVMSHSSYKDDTG